jgi:hypothetical protein
MHEPGTTWPQSAGQLQVFSHASSHTPLGQYEQMNVV